MCGFVLVLEHLNSSPFSCRHLGVCGNLSNYSTCVLWTCRKSAYHTSRSVLIGKLWEFGYQTCFCRLFCPCRKSLLHTVSSISHWFAVHVGLHQGRQLLLILFIIFIDRISRYRWTIADDVILRASSNEGSVRVSVKQLGWELESKSENLSQKRMMCPSHFQVGNELLLQGVQESYGFCLWMREGRGQEIDTRISVESAVMQTHCRAELISKAAELLVSLYSFLLSFIYGNRVWGVTQRMRLCTQTASSVCPQPWR